MSALRFTSILLVLIHCSQAFAQTQIPILPVLGTPRHIKVSDLRNVLMAQGVEIVKGFGVTGLPELTLRFPGFEEETRLAVKELGDTAYINAESFIADLAKVGDLKMRGWHNPTLAIGKVRFQLGDINNLMSGTWSYFWYRIGGCKNLQGRGLASGFGIGDVDAQSGDISYVSYLPNKNFDFNHTVRVQPNSAYLIYTKDAEPEENPVLFGMIKYSDTSGQLSFFAGWKTLIFSNQLSQIEALPQASHNGKVSYAMLIRLSAAEDQNACEIVLPSEISIGR